MLTGHVFIATSIDGFIARSNGEIDWLNALPEEGDDYGYGAFMDSVDGIIMGRVTFQKVLTFEEWPFNKPVVVLSHSLRAENLPVDLQDRVRIFDLEPLALAETLSAQGWQRAYVDGGKVIQSFLRAGLIADLVLSRIPVLLGEGLPLFGPLSSDIQLEHVETHVFSSGLVQQRYRIKQPPA